MPDWTAIRSALGDAGIETGNAAPRPVSGGDISSAWRLDVAESPVFLKTGPASSYEMFAAEAEGLAALAEARAVRVPAVLALGEHDEGAFVALEWLDFGAGDQDCERLLGQRLAAQHRCTQTRFGWHRDNTIGLTPQRNEWSNDWVGFFGRQRLGYQLQLAANNGFTGALQSTGARLIKRLPVFFENYTPVASLLHGDLWGGNWSCCNGEPVIFDPAVYYGDRETDLAMTRLFGGFSRAFYDAYESSWPLQPGHQERQDLYQLYHVLNHLNLFGAGYLGRALSLIEGLS
jgi:fructosamine-3-kinase